MGTVGNAPSVLLSRHEAGVLVLSNNNPAVRNALSPAFYQCLTVALQQAAADPAVGAIVLTGEGGHFCAGGDLRQLAKRGDLPLAERRDKLEGLHSLIRAVRDCPKPVIAAVEGAAVGAGLSLALACDMLVAARDSVFSMAYIKVGLTPDGGATAFLSEFVSRQLLTELCLIGERINGERMERLGVVNRLAEPGQAIVLALALAQQIAQGPALATARTKELCRQAPRNSLQTQLELEAQFMVLSQESAESREGIGAFLEKRAPQFRQLPSVLLTQ